MKQLTTRLLSVTAAIIFSLALQAQIGVRIGGTEKPVDGAVLDLNSAVKGGLLLPNIDIPDLGKIPKDGFVGITVEQETNAELAGTVVYNTNQATGLGIYLWDGNDWNKLSIGGTVTLALESGVDRFLHDGSTENIYRAADPSCRTPGTFIFTWLAGEEYIDQMTVMDAGTGRFFLKFQQNDRASVRHAILLIVAPCGTRNTFVFTQEGDQTGCNISTVPKIKSYNGNVLCANGAVYLYLDGFPATGDFIWTLNDVSVGTGNSFVATKPGKYIVYGDKIGCSNSDTFVVSLNNNSTAPPPVSFIVIGNNGMACGAGSKISLIVTQSARGTIVWYRNGEKTAERGDNILAGAGSWQAVVEDGSCSSVPTEPVTVTENQNASIAMPTMKINGQAANYMICRNGSMYLEVDSPDNALTYTWYKDNEQIGTGAAMYYTVPPDDRFVLRLRATGSGCASEVTTIENIKTDPVPSIPIIRASTGNVLCGGETTLSTSGGNTYRWFKNGIEISGQNTSILTVNEVGLYSVTAISAGGCAGQMSVEKDIVASDFATASWLNHPVAAKEMETKTFSIYIDFPTGAVYNWEVTPVSGGATPAGSNITNGQNTSSVTVKFLTAGKYKVKCSVATACGEALDSPLEEEVEVSAGCSAARITATSNLKVEIKTGQTAILRVTAAGSPLIYQWYKGTSGNKGTPINGAAGNFYTLPAADVSTVKTLNYWCEVISDQCNTVNSPTFTVTIKTNPKTLLNGTGSFSGKSCFDIATGNDNINGCTPKNSRQTQRTDFANRTEQDGVTAGPYSGVQVYTFKPNTNTKVSKIRFDYLEEIELIDSIVPKSPTYATAKDIETPCKVIVYFKPSLNEELKSTTRKTGYKLKLYVIYSRTGYSDEYKLELTASLQDCACCGAKMHDGKWLNFMCHNLGADENLDPFTWVNRGETVDDDIKGYLYQWGRKTDGHQSRSSKAAPIAAASYPTLDEYQKNPEKYPDFLRSANIDYNDWLKGADPSLSAAKVRWGSGAELNQTKGVNDPCPDGWKVPSMLQWVSIFRSDTKDKFPSSATSNTWTWKSNGFQVGESLFLPAAGIRNGLLNTVPIKEVSSRGGYWSSTYDSKAYSFSLDLYSGSIVPRYTIRAEGLSVRCVEDNFQ